MRRKREKPYLASQRPPKKPRSVPMTAETPLPINEREESSIVVVSGLASDSTVLELKSRFQLFGPISRLRIDQYLRLGYVTFRSRSSSEAAIAASLDPSCGITLRSSKVIVDDYLMEELVDYGLLITAQLQVQVSWTSDPLPQWSAGVGVSSTDGRPSSKLLRAEIPLSRQGRCIKKLGIGPTDTAATKSGSDSPFKGREIIAYDDLL